MINLNNYITEKLKINKESANKLYKPKTKQELIKLIQRLVKKEGCDANLNIIDTSEITDMSDLFNNSLKTKIRNINISDWNVSNVTTMRSMFGYCENFDCDLSDWDVSNVKDMSFMFNKCKNFKGTGLEDWNIKNVQYTHYMFSDCVNFDCDLHKWDTSNLTLIRRMFYRCYEFKGKGLENWNVSKVQYMDQIFSGCKSLINKPGWYRI